MSSVKNDPPDLTPLPGQAPGSAVSLRFPFFENFQIREDEGVALKALFEKAFYGTDFPPASIEALNRFRAKPTTEPKIGSSALAVDPTKYIFLNRGETGIGKTRVFRQFRRTAAERGIPVYEIHCYDVEGIPFKPFLRVIREILRDFEFSEVLKEKYRLALESLLPEIYQLDFDAQGNPDSPLDPGRDSRGMEADMVRLFDSLTHLLFEITALRPVVILVHDLHWGDRGTIELLRYIGRNLQLRNGRIAASQKGREPAGALPAPSGPESLDDGGEWRELISRSARVLEKTSPGSAGERTTLEPGEAVEDRPVRLMILANYCGSSDGNHYLERAIRSLGEELFTFHGEIRTLTLEETAGFVERSLAQGDLPHGQPRAVCDPEAFEPIYLLSDGFPSYIHELFRLIFLSDPVRSREPGIVINRALLAEVLGEGIPSRLGAGEGEASGSGAAADVPNRRRIIARRLSSITPDEQSILAALALARKPLPADFLARVVFEGQRPLEEVQAVLNRLEGRFFIERVRHEFPRRGEEAGFYFRIADYAAIAADGLTLEARQSIHQRIAAECRDLHNEEGDEKAYETFHHLKRGKDPRLAVEFGLLAARRLARSFSLEKAVQVCEEVLEILSPVKGAVGAASGLENVAESDQGEGAAPAVRAFRREVLDLKGRLHLRLKEYQPAEAALAQLIKEGGDALPEAERIGLIIRQADLALEAGDANRSLKILSKAFKLVKDKNSSEAARLHVAVARAHLAREDTKKAINFCLNGLKICQKIPESASSPEEFPELYRILARAHTLRGDYSHAVDHFQRGFEWLERQGRKASAAEVLDDLGRVYLQRGNYFRAARYLYKSLEIKRREQDIVGLSRSYDELGRVYLRTGDELKTIEHLNRSLALKERVGDLAGLNPTLGILGGLYQRLGQFQRAIRYFKREIDNSQLLSDTRGLVDAFLHLGWVYLEVGELKQVENLSRQIAILAVEFKLRAQEAEGARLMGLLAAMDRDWGGAEKHLRQAIEIHSKLGDRRHEAESLLDLAEIKFNRELYDESLKFASKGQILAEGLKAVDLQARSQVIKGNVYRFLKGGNAEKAKELLRRALELGQNLNDVRLQFEIFYSLAKVYHYDREFAEAGNFYGKAEAILRRVAEGLPGDMAARFFEDRRRKLFSEDAARFRKEVQSRTATGTAIDLKEKPSAVDLKEKPVGLTDYKDLTARFLRIHGAIQQLDFGDRLLAEGQELVKAERGMVLRVQNRLYSVEASSGFGTEPTSHPEYAMAHALAEEAVRRGRPILHSGGEDEEKQGKAPRLATPRGRAVLAIPILTAERVFGGLYLDRPISHGRFSSRDLVMAETFAAHGGCALENRRQYESAIREPGTGFYTPIYFLERLKDAFRWHNLHGRPFYLLGFYVPSLEGSMGIPGGLGEKVSAELSAALPRGSAASWWSPMLGVLLFDADLAVAEATQARVGERLQALLQDDVHHGVLGPNAKFPDGTSIYNELRRTLLPEECDVQTLTEIRRLLAREITLKEAKKILEKHIIESTLRKTGGNITHAAKELGIHRPQLSNLLKKYALKREVYERDFEDIQLNPLDN